MRSTHRGRPASETSLVLLARAVVVHAIVPDRQTDHGGSDALQSQSAHRIGRSAIETGRVRFELPFAGKSVRWSIPCGALPSSHGCLRSESSRLLETAPTASVVRLRRGEEPFDLGSARGTRAVAVVVLRSRSRLVTKNSAAAWTRSPVAGRSSSRPRGVTITSVAERCGGGRAAPDAPGRSHHVTLC
jgi:hypothetical protein